MKVAADLAYPDELYTSTMSSSFNDLTNNIEKVKPDAVYTYYLYYLPTSN